VSADFYCSHSIALGIPLQGVHIPEVKVCALVEYREHDAVAVGDFLNVEVAAVRTVVDRQRAAGCRGDADHADHRFGFELQFVAPVHDAVFDDNVAVLDAEFLFPTPVRKDADPGPKCGVAQAMHADFDHVDDHHVPGLRAAQPDGAGGGIDEGQRYFRCVQLFVETGDEVTADIQFGLDLEGFAGHYLGDEAVGGGKRVLEFALADDLQVAGCDIHG